MVLVLRRDLPGAVPELQQRGPGRRRVGGNAPADAVFDRDRDGSLLCERLSGHKVELGLVPFGSIGLSLFAIDLYFAARGLGAHATANWLGFLGVDGAVRVVADLLLIGVFGGFFIVPSMP